MKTKLTWKIWLLIIVVGLSLISIFGFPPAFLNNGVLIKHVDSNSTAFEQGLRPGQVIEAIDGREINNADDFSNIIREKFLTDEKIKISIQTKDAEYILFTNQPPQIIVSDISKTNIKLGLDLSGGARALIQAENKSLSFEETEDLKQVVNNRLNVYGLEDITAKVVSDLSGNYYLLVEIAGATPKDLEDLVSKQGKFEAKIGNETIFIGGERDVTSVCRNDPTCAGIELCDQASEGNYFCNFNFVIYLSEEAAQRHADITKNLGVNVTTQGRYLSQKLDLYVDDILVDSLLISEGLKGRVTTQIQIQGPGTGTTIEEAKLDAEDSMNKLQTILITGSLPFKLEIIKLDTISPTLGKDFIKTILLAGIGALLAVSLIIFMRYRKIKTSFALLSTSLSEIIIILGIASFISWNLDLPSIAGILATVGTGIDQQIIVLDESRRSKFLSLVQRLKRAFATILGAYFTASVSLLPLLWAGAGLLKGFAITTLIGITAGILVTRPAFTDIVKKIEE
ncbi:hypothetical protein J4225_02510 [Candidatus Pacearchaeota archaeon]|nr:hypothetical protein [Candidatus Pacearchaeota archaeon]